MKRGPSSSCHEEFIIVFQKNVQRRELKNTFGFLSSHFSFFSGVTGANTARISGNKTLGRNNRSYHSYHAVNSANHFDQRNIPNGRRRTNFNTESWRIDSKGSCYLEKMFDFVVFRKQSWQQILPDDPCRKTKKKINALPQPCRIDLWKLFDSEANVSWNNRPLYNLCSASATPYKGNNSVETRSLG